MTDLQKFQMFLTILGLRFDTDGNFIELDPFLLEGDGYLSIKFYDDGSFQEFIHYPN